MIGYCLERVGRYSDSEFESVWVNVGVVPYAFRVWVCLGEHGVVPYEPVAFRFDYMTLMRPGNEAWVLLL